MAQEIRKITFSLDELALAFEAYGRRTPQFLPGGRITSCNIVEDEGVRVVFAMEYGSSTNDVEFVYRGSDILRPLILFCIENNIMLPRDGRKALTIEGSQVGLVIELDLDTEFSMVTAPLMSEHIRLIKDDASSLRSVRE